VPYDIVIDVFVASCVPAAPGRGRGFAWDPSDGNLWLTFIDQFSSGERTHPQDHTSTSLHTSSVP
jgi:hypothetical protein